jgi:hypothetical protein
MTAIDTGGVQSGDGLMDWIKGAKKAHDWVKKNKIISRGASVVSTLGGDAYLNKKTGGKYSLLVLLSPKDMESLKPKGKLKERSKVKKNEK